MTYGTRDRRAELVICRRAEPSLDRGCPRGAWSRVRVGVGVVKCINVS